MTDARRRAEEALADYDRAYPCTSDEVHQARRCVIALRALLAEPHANNARLKLAEDVLRRFRTYSLDWTEPRVRADAAALRDAVDAYFGEGAYELAGPHATVAPARDIWFACGCPDPNNCEHVFVSAPVPPAPDEVREALAAARELLAAVRTGYLASIGAERNVYVPQIGVAWLTPLADKIELGAALAAVTPRGAADEVREAAFARFGRALLPKWWDDGNPGDIDGGDAQEAAEAAGLWHPVERHPDGVECEWCGNEGPCGELTEAGLSALAARGGAG